MIANNGTLGVLLAAVLLGCGPSVSEVRMVNYPPREQDCSLEFVRVDMKELSDGAGPWELIGHVILSQEGTRDPFAEEYRAVVRPRACAMGGEAVAIVTTGTAEGVMTTGTTISYGVLRKRGSKPEAPTTF
jgi:hypothetical protein